MRVRFQRRAPKLRASAELERGGGEGTQSAAGSAPRPLVVAGAGLRHTRAATSARRFAGRRPGGSLLVPQDNPGTELSWDLESRPRRDALVRTKLGRRDARCVGPPVRAPLPEARHYLHEDAEEQGSDPYRNGQLPHGAAGAGPA